MLDLLEEDLALLELRGSRLHPLLELRVERPQLAHEPLALELRALPFRDVDDRAQHEATPGGREGVEPDLDRDLRAVATQAEEVAARAHGPGFRVAEEGPAETRMACAEALGHQHLDRLANHFLARVPEDPLDRGVDEHDASALVHEDHAGRGGLDRELKLLGVSVDGFHVDF